MSIFVIDEHPLMREALGAMIGRMGHSAVELANVAALAGAVKAHGHPELITLDLELAGEDLDSLTTVRHLRDQFPDTPIVVLTAAPAQVYENRALEAGATAFIHKSAKTDAIAQALRELLGDEASPESAAPLEKLSKRQKQLLQLLDKGMSNRDIAESLQISEHTVKVHLWRLFRRLNVKSRSQAGHLARTQGLL
ncbi:MAG: response regulator transcription factor [Pseudomonadota bacterium]